MDPLSRVASKRVRNRTEDFIRDLEEDLRNVYGDVEVRVGEALSRIVGFTAELREDDEGYILAADLAGVAKEDIDLRVVEEQTIEIEAKRMEPILEDDERYLIQERVYGPIKRSFALPTKIDQETVEAELTDGVLTVRMLKAEETRGQRIEVK